MAQDDEGASVSVEKQTPEQNKKPIVIQVCLSTAFGGLEVAAMKWTRLFSEAGYDSQLICTRSSKLAELAKTQGLITIEFDKPTSYYSPSARRDLKFMINRLQPKIFFSHRDKDLWHLSPVLEKYPEILLISFARTLIRGTKKNTWLHRKIYRRVNKMIALSQIQKSLLLNSLPLEDNKYKVIPKGVNTEKFYPRKGSDSVRTSLGANGPGLLIGLIGRLDIQKGQTEFIEAARIIHEKHPEVKFVIVGGENRGKINNSAERLKSLVEKHQLEGVLTLTGHRDDIPGILNALDIFCMPSYEENFGNVLLEAMASGLACVGTNSGGTPEIISEGYSGILVSPKSSEALAGGLLRLIEDEELRSYVSENARSVASDRFAIENVFRSVEDLIDDLSQAHEEPET